MRTRDARTGGGTRSAKRARRQALERLCEACHHPWGEHPEAVAASDATCSECEYELEHGFSDRAACRRSIPMIVLDVP